MSRGKHNNPNEEDVEEVIVVNYENEPTVELI